MACSSCGAALSPGATWCSQCFARFDAPPPPEKPLEMTRVYSRWHKGPTSFGPMGRIGATLALVLFEWWLLKVNIFGFAITMLTIVPLVLRDVWKRTPVHHKIPTRQV